MRVLCCSTIFRMPIPDLTARIQPLLPAFAGPGVRLGRTWSLKGGISSHMTAFEVELADGSIRRHIARQPGEWKYREDPKAAETEAKILRSVREAGIPAPAVLAVEPPSPDVPHPLFILEYIEGDTNLSPSDVGAYVSRYADMLAKIHRVDLAEHAFEMVPKPVGRSWIIRRGEPNDELRETEIVAALDAYSGEPCANLSVLRHGDFWPGNVLWREGEIVGVIDWEEPEIGEPLADLAISRLDILWVLGWEAMLEFTDLYLGQMNLDSTALPYWDLAAALRPTTQLPRFASAYPPMGRPDIDAEKMARDHSRFVKHAFSRLK